MFPDSRKSLPHPSLLKFCTTMTALTIHMLFPLQHCYRPSRSKAATCPMRAVAVKNDQAAHTCRV